MFQRDLLLVGPYVSPPRVSSPESLPSIIISFTHHPSQTLDVVSRMSKALCPGQSLRPSAQMGSLKIIVLKTVIFIFLFAGTKIKLSSLVEELGCRKGAGIFSFIQKRRDSRPHCRKRHLAYKDRKIT